MTISKSKTATIELLDQYFTTAFSAPEGIPKLRELILSLAMQGQLVPQNPDDKPAKELLKDIEGEKQRLIKEGKIKKSNPLPDITPDEIPYEIPDSWEWVRLGDIGESNIGLTYSPSDLNDIGIPVLRSNNIQNGQLDLSDLKRVNTKIKESAFVNDGDLLICVRNGSEKLVGKTALIKGLSEKMAFGAFMAIFRSPINEYLFRFINSSLFKQMISEVNTMTINQITQKNLKSTIFPLPPLEEQKKIVEEIESLMEKCDRLEKLQNEREDKRLKIQLAVSDKLLNATDKQTFDEAWQFIEENFETIYSVKENVKQLRQMILQLAVMGKLVPQDAKDKPARELLKDIEIEKQRLIKEGKIKPQKPLPPITPNEIPYNIPDSWEWVRLGNIALHNSGKTKDQGKNTGTLKKYITTSNLYWGYFDLSNIREMPIKDQELDKCTAIKNDLLICEGGDAGRASVWFYEESICFQNHIHRVRFFCDINPYYGYRFFEKLNATKEIEKYRKGVAIHSISGKVLGSIILPLPPLEEQKRIVKKVDKMMKLCDELEEKITAQTDTQTKLLNAVIAQI